MEYLFFGGGIIYFLVVLAITLLSIISYFLVGVGVTTHMMIKEVKKEKEKVKDEFYNEWL